MLQRFLTVKKTETPNQTVRVSKYKPSPGKSMYEDWNKELKQEICFCGVEYGKGTEKGEETEILVKVDLIWDSSN